MKTGKPTRLAEKLNADLTSLRQEHIDLINSQMSSFRQDLNDIVSSAQHTIKSDIRTFQARMNAAQLMNATLAEQMLRLSPKTLVICVLSMILTLMAASMLWQWAMTSMAMTARMQRLGMQTVEAEGATWLVLNYSQTQLQNCKMGGQPVMCIRMED